MEELKDKLLNLKSGDRYEIDQGHEAAFIIYKIHSVWVCFLIPLFGGEETYLNTFQNINYLIEAINFPY